MDKPAALEPAQMTRLQGLLERRKQALLAQMADDSDAIGWYAAAVKEIDASPADNASARILNELVHEAAKHKMAQLGIIKHALAKFADDRYGSCENCGEAIGWSRLNARPEARFCIACQTRMEQTRR